MSRWNSCAKAALTLGLLASRASFAVAEEATPVQPVFTVPRDATLAGAGALGLALGLLWSPDVEPVPASGLDPAGIRFDFDRDSIGPVSVPAYDASNVLLVTSYLLPVALAAIEAPEGARVESTVRRALLFGESLLLTNGTVALVKSAVSRPRPFTYIDAAERPDHTSYEVDEGRAFASMPSGHAAQAWCAATFVVTDHLITRPQAHWFERAGVGFLGGAIATATATLRVDAGQHFPSDVWAGGSIGAACGIGVPLAHPWVAGDRAVERPSARAWSQAAAGMAVGVAAGFLVAEWTEN